MTYLKNQIASPVSYFDQPHFGDLLGRFTSDVETVSNALQQSFLQIVNAIFTLSLVIVMVLYLNLTLGLIRDCFYPDHLLRCPVDYEEIPALF